MDSVKSKVWKQVLYIYIYSGKGVKVMNSEIKQNRKLVIEKLTDKQIEKIPEYVKKWVDIGFSTNNNFTEKQYRDAVDKLYTCAGLFPPQEIHVTDNPFEAINFVLKRKEGSTAKEIFDNFCWGQYLAGSLSFYSFFKDVVKLENLNNIDGLIAMANVGGWFLPYDNCIVIVRKAVKICLDSTSRLHSLTEAAYQFAGNDHSHDLFFVHGIPVSRDLIEQPERITVSRIDQERNQEMKRIMIEIMGVKEYLKKSEVKIIDKDIDNVGNERILYEKSLSDGVIYKMVKVINSTPRFYDIALPELKKKLSGQSRKVQEKLMLQAMKFDEYFLRVPPEVKTCKEAVAWTFFKTIDTYNPEVEG